MSRSWRAGSTPAWRAVRALVLARDGYRCRAHDEGWCERADAGEHVCSGMAHLGGQHAGHAHHTIGRDVTGDDPAHIIAACRACNLAIGEPVKYHDPDPRPRTAWGDEPG